MNLEDFKKRAVEKFVNKVASSKIQFEQVSSPEYYGQIVGLNKILKEEVDKFLDQAIKERDARLFNLLKDHYWDTLEKDRDLIIKHIEEVMKM